MTSVQITSQANIGLDPRLPHREAELLEWINQGLPADIQRRYDDLQAKLHHETIAPDEHQELLSLIDTVEQASADRLGWLIELSQLRQVSLDESMTQIGIHHPPVYA